MKVLVFIKGKAKPLLFTEVKAYTAAGELTLTFEDTNELVLAEGQWREARIQRFEEAPQIVEEPATNDAA